MDKIATKEALTAVAQTLNDKIEQPFIYIEVSLPYLSSISDDVKRILRESIENGTIYNVILVNEGSRGTSSESSARIIAVNYAADLIMVYNPANADIESIDISA